jgi:hypothetical protein
MLLDFLIDDNAVDLDSGDVRFIKDLIQGVSRKTYVVLLLFFFLLCLYDTNARYNDSDEKAFLFDIVANKRNSVDVDKFDYIQRDCYNVGLKSSYDSSRLSMFCRVINNQICYSHKEVR